MKLSSLVLLAASMTDAAPAAEASAPAAVAAETPAAEAPSNDLLTALFSEQDMEELLAAFEAGEFEDEEPGQDVARRADEENLEEDFEDDNDFSLEDLMELASMFEDAAEEHEEVARRSDDPSADLEFEDDNDFDFSLEDLMAALDEMEDDTESNVARRSDDAAEQAPAADEDFSLEDLMELASLLEQDADLEGYDLEGDDDLEDFDENELEDFNEEDFADFANFFENEEPEAEW